MRLIRILVNWIGLLSLPIWGGTAILFALIEQMISESLLSRVLTGETFFWK